MSRRADIVGFYAGSEHAVEPQIAPLSVILDRAQGQGVRWLVVGYLEEYLNPSLALLGSGQAIDPRLQVEATWTYGRQLVFLYRVTSA